MPYISNTDKQRKEMLSALGLGSVDDLFKDIPSQLKAASFDMPAGKSELEVRRHLMTLAGKNNSRLVCFLGGGFYDHFIPSAVDSIISRSEFYTAYTPYQPEISQGTLQGIYEYQSAVCSLTEMDAANASLYDGGTALCEAVMMSVRITKRNKVIIDKGVNPIYSKIVRTGTDNLNLEFVETAPGKDGRADRTAIADAIDDKTACLVLQNPNFFGCLDDITDLAEKAHKSGCVVILSVYPMSLGVLKTPGAMDADIAVGEGQSLGLQLSFGGPYLGFMATRTKYLRNMPGRIVGRTVDKNGKDGFVLTLQTREQHIRREKATSNICSNEALCALTAVVYLSLMGKKGFKQAAELCFKKSHYCQKRLADIPGVKMKFSAPFFNEFTVELPVNAAGVIAKLIEKDIIAGFPPGKYYKGMEKCMLVAVTEKRTKEEIDILAEAIKSAL
jgi:glycine dehydrogenase subunit 1